MESPKIGVQLTYENQAEQAVRFYVSCFKSSRIGNITYWGEDEPLPAGAVRTVKFWLNGQSYTAVNGGPHFKFTDGVSLVVNCATQQEIDELWEKLPSQGGKTTRCGWLFDRWGVSWQIVPSILDGMVNDPDRQKSQRVFKAFLQMTKIDVATLKRAYEGGRPGGAGDA